MFSWEDRDVGAAAAAGAGEGSDRVRAATDRADMFSEVRWEVRAVGG